MCEYLKLFLETEMELLSSGSEDYKQLAKVKELDDIDELMGSEFYGYASDCIDEADGYDVVEDREYILDMWADISEKY